MSQIYTDSENRASLQRLPRLPKVNIVSWTLFGMNHPDFSARFREACQAVSAPSTMEALGRYLGVSTSMAWNYHTGEKLPSMEKAIEIAMKLGVCVEWLLTGRGPRVPPAPPNEVLDLSELSEEARRNLRALVDSIRPGAKKKDAA